MTDNETVTAPLLLRSAERLGELSGLNPPVHIFCNELALCVKRAMRLYPTAMAAAIEYHDQKAGEDQDK